MAEWACAKTRSWQPLGPVSERYDWPTVRTKCTWTKSHASSSASTGSRPNMAEPEMPQVPQGLGDVRAAHRAAYDDMNRVLAALHSVDYKAKGLEDYGKPGNYFERQINRWTKQYVAAKTHEIAPMNELLAWLPKNVPSDDTTTIVHGDY